jgi:hypothetical protein
MHSKKLIANNLNVPRQPPRGFNYALQARSATALPQLGQSLSFRVDQRELRPVHRSLCAPSISISNRLLEMRMRPGVFFFSDTKLGPLRVLEFFGLGSLSPGVAPQAPGVPRGRLQRTPPPLSLPSLPPAPCSSMPMGSPVT